MNISKPAVVTINLVKISIHPILQKSYSRAAWKILALMFSTLLFMAGGCQTRDDQTSTDSTPAPVIFITATPSPGVEPSPTDEPTAAPTSNPAPSPTSTAESFRRLPVNWQEKGSDRFGIVVPAPREWSDVTYLLRESEAFHRFGPLFLLLVDDEETASRLMTGVPIEDGAYLFAYVGKSVRPSDNAAEALSQVIFDLGIEAFVTGGSLPLENPGVQGAYADLSVDPLNVFPSVEQRLSYRIVLYTPSDGVPSLLIMAASPTSWETYLNTFSTMMELVELPQTNDRVLGHIDVGEAVSGNLIRETSDIWTFNGQEGQFATITLSPDDARIDMTLTLIEPDGTPLVTVDDGYEGDPEVLTDILLPVRGTYVVEVREFFNEIGRYSLSLAMNDEAQFGGGGPIDFGQEITSELVENGEHSWTFNGTVSQDITIILSSLDDQLDVILELFSPDGVLLGLWDEGFAGDAEVATGVELPLTGEYSILVHGFAGHGGRYSLLLDEGGEDVQNLYDAGDLIPGEPRREYLREDEVHAWFFEGQDGAEIAVEVTPYGSNMDLEISLADENLSDYLQTADEFIAGESETIFFTLPEDVLYVVIVREFFGEPGEYEISLESTIIKEYDVAGEITIGQTVESSLDQGLPSAWILDGAEGQSISVVLEPLDADRDLVLELIDPEGGSAAFQDLSLIGLPERLENFRLTSSGQWKIVVREFFGEAASYRMFIFTVAE